MLLSLISLAQAADCAAPMSVEAWSTNLRALREGVALADDGVDLALDALEREVTCVAGPLSAADIAALWLARGAWTVLRNEQSPDTKNLFNAAKAVGGEGAWDALYGPEVERFFADAATPKGASTLNFYLPHQVLAIDGEVRYESSPILLHPGPHLIQWSEDGAWAGQWIRLDPGGMAFFGAPAPPPPVAPTPERPRMPRSSGGFVTLGVAGLNGSFASSEGIQIEGRDGSPLLASDAWFGVGPAWARLSIVSASMPTTTDFPWPAGIGLYGGAALLRGALSLNAGLGVRGVSVPLVRTYSVNGTAYPPEFTVGASVGGALLLDSALTRQRLVLRARLDAYVAPDAQSMELGLGAGFPLTQHTELTLGGSAGAVRWSPPNDGQTSWWTATGGTRWSF